MSRRAAGPDPRRPKLRFEVRLSIERRWFHYGFIVNRQEEEEEEEEEEEAGSAPAVSGEQGTPSDPAAVGHLVSSRR